jgi:nucleoid-associated protein YgaU
MRHYQIRSSRLHNQGVTDTVRLHNEKKHRGAWMQRVIASGLLAVFLMATAQAQNPRPDAVRLNGDVPMTYTVKRGDTLWDISDMYLEEPWRWPELWEANPEIDNPHLIYPGDVLSLRWENGRPRLSLGSRGDVKLSPKMRSEALDTAIPPIPRDQVDAWLRANRVIDPLTVDAAPYIVGTDAQRLIAGMGDRVYARGPVDAADQTYLVVREGKTFVDPITQEMLGVEVRDMGTAALLAPPTREFTDEEVKELELTRTTEEVRRGDRLLPQEEGVVDAFFQPKAPDVTIEDGFMIAVDGGVTQIGALDIVTINRGSREGLEVGDVLAIYQTGETVKDPVKGDMVQLPDARAGVLMLFAVYEKASYGLVMKASRPLSVGDKVKNP